MSSLGKHAIKLGTDAAKLGINTLQTGVNIAGNVVDTARVLGKAGTDITSYAAVTAAGVTNSAKDIAISTSKTAAGVAEVAGEIAISGAKLAASTTAILANLSKNVETISQNSIERRENLEKIKNKEVENLKNLKDVENTKKTELQIANLEANTNIEKQQILDAAELAKQQQILKAEQDIQNLEIENEQNKINSQFDRELSRVENIQNEKNFKQSLMYGFETDEEPYNVRSTLYEEVGNKKYFKYFFPIGVIDTKTGIFFAIVLPESDSPRINDELICKDKDGNVVKITFENVVKKRIFRRPTTKIEPFVTVTKLNPVSNNSETQPVPGKLMFGVKTYFKYKQPVRQGGKSRRQIKKHRVGYKKTKKRKNTKTRNKRRTNYKA